MNGDRPFLSVLTPVHNGGKYLAECITSVLNQDHKNFEYIIINNCSKDNSLEIALRYARNDSRIRVIDNETFVGVIENHNIAFSQISPDSAFCKVVSADDWIYPECLRRQVWVALKYPSVGIVGSYAFKEGSVRGLGLPISADFFSGRSVGRLRLLGTDIIGSPTALLYRSDIIRNQKPFFSGTDPNADIASCLRILNHNDYGFVHQILSFEREHNDSIRSTIMRFHPFLVDRLEFLSKYGHIYLTPQEYNDQHKELLNSYYEHLAAHITEIRDKEFWDYHRNRMHRIHSTINYARLIYASIMKLLNLALNPAQTAAKLLKRVQK
jgi:glycosyltransferase involved in cell wall biosynthesis